MDGARLFNAAVALGVDAAHLAACADSVMFCLSKGLGAPFGSVLCGTREFIAKARQTRKLLGGGMRQAGIMAAAGLVALRTGIERLAEDHENARHLGAALAAYDEFVLTPVQSNIVMLDISASGRSSEWFEQKLAPLGLLAKGMGKDHLPWRKRACVALPHPGSHPEKGDLKTQRTTVRQIQLASGVPPFDAEIRVGAVVAREDQRPAGQDGRKFGDFFGHGARG